MSRVRAVLNGREEGMSTAEYAIGVCGAGGFAALLFTLLTKTWGDTLIGKIGKMVFSVLGL